MSGGSRMKGVAFSAIILVAIVVASSLIVISIAMPTLKKGTDYQDISEAKQIMNTLDSVINELNYESSGATRTMKISSDAGRLVVSGKDDSIKFVLNNEIKLFEPGTRTKEGNLVISSGPNLKAYEADVDNDGDIDLILENDVLIFAIEKKDPGSFVNTSDIISLVQIKPDTNVIPKAKIIIDDVPDSYFGYGFTELARKGENLPSSSIRLVMNSSSGINYEAVFTLGPNHDYVEMDIRHISGSWY